MHVRIEYLHVIINAVNTSCHRLHHLEILCHHLPQDIPIPHLILFYAAKRFCDQFQRLDLRCHPRLVQVRIAASDYWVLTLRYVLQYLGYLQSLVVQALELLSCNLTLKLVMFNNFFQYLELCCRLPLHRLLMSFVLLCHLTHRILIANAPLCLVLQRGVTRPLCLLDIDQQSVGSIPLQI